MLTKERKQAIIQDYGASPEDSGSVEVQVALLTARITELTEHMRHNHKDFGCQRGLLTLVGERRRKLAYLSREDIGRYRALIARLGLRR
ncbi:MAG: 30S ribosomal protein S15 [Chloroflexi bacterium]|nr:30S ribosomal protein S15 [Chloroflexota bacterium]